MTEKYPHTIIIQRYRFCCFKWMDELNKCFWMLLHNQRKWKINAYHNKIWKVWKSWYELTQVGTNWLKKWYELVVTQIDYRGQFLPNLICPKPIRPNRKIEGECKFIHVFACGSYQVSKYTAHIVQWCTCIYMNGFTFNIENLSLRGVCHTENSIEQSETS